MTATRVFLTQQALQEGMGKGTLNLDGEMLTIRDPNIISGGADVQMQLVSAVRFVEALTEEPESMSLLGKVKDHTQLKKMNADHCDTSVVIGETAYRVEEGFVGEALAGASSEKGKPATHSTSGRPAPRNSELEVLAKLFVKKQR